MINTYILCKRVRAHIITLILVHSCHHKVHPSKTPPRLISPMSATKTHGILSGAADQFEFDEAEIWASLDTVVYKPAVSRQRPVRKPFRKSSIKMDAESHAVGPSSLPVNIPDWSKILGREHPGRAADDLDLEGEDGDEDQGDKMAPHEYLARTRVASLSVHEGVGRTLKGRDLSRVRNAIWKQTGFELD